MKSLTLILLAAIFTGLLLTGCLDKGGDDSSARNTQVIALKVDGMT